MNIPKCIVLLLSAWVASQLFDGPLRFALVSAGLAVLLYVRDLMLAMALVLGVIRYGIGMPLATTLVVILLGSLAALIQSRPMGQVLFAVKIAVPFLFGVAIADQIPSDAPGKRAWWMMVAAFGLVVAGVFVNQAIEWPWEGMQYAIEGVSGPVQGAKVWSTMGIKRIPGFSRSSYDAAVAIAILSVAVIAGWEKLFVAVPVLVIASAATWVTTTKGILLNLAIAGTDVMLRAVCPPIEKRFFVPWLSAALILIVIAMPLQSLAGATAFDTSTEGRAFLLKSMNDRLEDCWPSAFTLIFEQGNLLTGRGLGGLGTPQVYYENEIYNPCDNLLIYLLGNLGIFGSLFLPFLAFKVVWLTQSEARFDRLLSLSGLLILSYGMTANVLESPFLGLIAGLISARGNGPLMVPPSLTESDRRKSSPAAPAVPKKTIGNRASHGVY